MFNYNLPTGDCGRCSILAEVNGFLKIRDEDCGAVLYIRPEWIEKP